MLTVGDCRLALGQCKPVFKVVRSAEAGPDIAADAHLGCHGGEQQSVACQTAQEPLRPGCVSGTGDDTGDLDLMHRVDERAGTARASERTADQGGVGKRTS